MTDNERLDFAIGQVAALKSFCVALVSTHANPDGLVAYLSLASEVAAAKSLPTLASDAMVEGLERMQNDLLAIVQREVQRRATKSS